MSEETQVETPRGRVYLDNAATTWPKSSAATAAALDFLETCGATAGRGVYASAQQADRWLRTARQRLAELVSAGSSQEIAFCNSGTHALNAALNGVLQPGDHVITTGLEHNSVLRPLKHWQQTGRIDFDVVPVDSSGIADPGQAAGLIRPSTRLLVVGHASNVTGRAHQLSDWAQFARDNRLLFAVDASQTLGYLPIDMRGTGIDILAAAGHKGLRAWSGTGLLAVSQALQSEFLPWMYGGTGLASESIDDVPAWPQSVEAGNLNIPAAVSMAVAAEELNALPDLVAGWLPVFQRLIDGLRAIPGVRVLGDYPYPSAAQGVPPAAPGFVPVVSLVAEGWDVHDLAAVLDSAFQIEARAGWHCAALIHGYLGGPHGQGTLRLSTSRATTADSIDYTLQAIQSILRQ